MLDENLQVIHYILESLKMVFEAFYSETIVFAKNHNGIFSSSSSTTTQSWAHLGDRNNQIFI